MAYQMTASDAITQTYLLATGKIVPPTSGTNKYSKILALLNLYQRIWALQDGVDWNSLRDTFYIDTVSATDTFPLDTDMASISSQQGDFVRIAHTDGINESQYTIVPISRLYDDGPIVNSAGVSSANAVGTCAQSGSNLVFSRAFTTDDPQYGGTISVPGTILPDTLVNSGDIIQVDDPDWLCFRAAAEYIRNDVTRVQLYQSLLDQAEDRMNTMLANNGSQKETTYRGGWSPLGDTWS